MAAFKPSYSDLMMLKNFPLRNNYTWLLNENKLVIRLQTII